MGEHLSDAQRDIATLTFDLAGDGPDHHCDTGLRHGILQAYTNAEVRIGLSVRKI